MANTQRSTQRPTRLADRLDAGLQESVFGHAAAVRAAKALVVRERTACIHVSATSRKLGLVSRIRAALWEMREGASPGARTLAQGNGATPG